MKDILQILWIDKDDVECSNLKMKAYTKTPNGALPICAPQFALKTRNNAPPDNALIGANRGSIISGVERKPGISFLVHYFYT